MTHTTRQHRRGSIYIAVLGTAMLVTVIGLSALMTLRIERTCSEGTSDLAQARMHAQSAIEIGMHRIDTDADWRNTYPSGVWESDQPIGHGTYTLEGVDPDDNNLKDDDADPVVLTGTGVQGAARYKLQVTVVTEVDPLSCLEVSLHGGNSLIFSNPASVNGDQVISANNVIQAIGACTIMPDCEAVNGFLGAVGPGSKTSGIAPRAMPDEAAVFDYYIANGTPITVPGNRIDKYVISSGSNPFGPTTNPQGIYVIDCQLQDFTITKSRIVGTLVLLNTGSNSEIKPEVNWEPAIPNLPALLVQGPLKIDVGSTDLTESYTITLNPPGTPYLGIEDGDLDDSYPPIIKGLVYVSNDLSTANNVTIDGVMVVGNTLNGTGVLNLTYRQTYLDTPPPGFYTPAQMHVADGSWQQVVD